MSQSDTKPWERPWSTQEMIEKAPNWNLAGDSGLLKYLEDFSEKMLSKVKDTNDRLNDLIDSADETSLALHNATNEFMGLRNTQFIESRVYEDDETLPTKQTPEKEEKPKTTEADRLEEMKNAICNGLEIIDKYYEKVEIPESDSEDDTDGPNILYRSVDPYIDRPLPYVIGTTEWHKYLHVGLGHSSSDSEVENDQDQFSETESEQEIQNLPERDRSQIPGISDSESEDLPKKKMSKPVANSTFNDNTNRNMFDSSSDSETGSVPPQVNTVNSNFAEELAAKLGKVESANIQPEVNTKPIKKQPSNIAGGLFSDEPPPLDDDDIFVKKNMNSGLFSGGDNLFDDVDDDSDFWNVKAPTTKTASVTVAPTVNKPKDDLFAEEDDHDDKIFSSEPNKQTEKHPAKKATGLFDEDDEDLFSTATLAQPKKPILAPFKTTAPLVSEEPPELESNVGKSKLPQEETKKKKPIGGVSVLGPNALLQQHILKKRAPSSSESDDSEPTKPVEPKVQTSEVETKKLVEIPKVASIFDDTSPLFSDDIFNNSSTKKFTSNLFDPEPSKDDDLFKVNEKGDNKICEQTEKPKPSPKPNLVDNTVNNKQEEKQGNKIIAESLDNNTKPNLFVDEPPPLSHPINKKSTLFDNDDKVGDLFSTKPKVEIKNEENPSNSKLFSRKSESLFDDFGDDLFSSKSSNFATNKSKVDLFDPNPPELDESDNKSECQSQFSLENEPVSYGSMNAGRASLFDTEPPMLSNESSGIVKDQSSSRFEGEDSSFYPYLTSSRRHSDLFQDQSDSVLTGRNKLSHGGDSNPSLRIIPENETMTKIDFTPSGNESSLLNNILNDTSVEQPVNKSSSLFDDGDLFKETQEKKTLFDNTESDANLFNEPKPQAQNSEKVSLFQDGNSDFNKQSEKQENKNVSFPEESDSAPNLFKDKKPEIPKKKNITLFQESDSDDDDLFSNKSSGSKNSSASDILNNSSVKPTKTLKNKNIFEDDLFSGPNVDGIPDVDIFNKNKNIETSSSDEFNNTKSINDKNDDLFVLNEDIKEQKLDLEQNINKINNTKKFNYEENLKSDEVKTDPKKSLSFEKNIEPEMKEEVKEETDGQILSAGSSPGKLRHSLNINVAALLPGASPPRRQNLEKSTSLDSSESNQNVPTYEEKAKSTETIPESKPMLDKSINFEQPIEAGEILISANKERVKIPVRRRPSTRRARQEALRKSAIDLNFEDAITEKDKNINESESPPGKIENQNILNIANNNITKSTTNVEETKVKNPLLNPLSPSTDEEDFLTMPRDKDLSSENFKDSLFGKAPVISPVDLSSTEDEIKRNIQTNESNKTSETINKPDNLFGVINSPPKETVNKINIQTAEPIKTIETSKTKDLFRDADDIFVSKKKETQSKKIDSSIFSSSDSENDLFSTPKTELKKSVNNNLIASPDEDLFKPVVSTASAIPNTRSKVLLRDDSLFDDEDIFSSKKIPPKSGIIKKSLFDDDDDNDDDIFGGNTSSSVTKHNTQTQSSVKKTTAPSRLKKLSSGTVQDIDDPLEALKK